MVMFVDNGMDCTVCLNILQTLMKQFSGAIFFFFELDCVDGAGVSEKGQFFFLVT